METGRTWLLIALSGLLLLALAGAVLAATIPGMVNRAGRPITVYGPDIFSATAAAARTMAAREMASAPAPQYDALLHPLDAAALEETLNKTNTSYGRLGGLIALRNVDAATFTPAITRELSAVEIYPKAHAFLDVSNGIIEANQTRALFQNDTFLNGTGQTVCVLDTGVDYNDTALGGCFGPGCRVVGGYDYVNNDTDPMDDNGHGTHVSGIIMSSDALYGGIAPGAHIAMVKVLDASGSGSYVDVIKGIDWCVAHQAAYNISVISMSLGTLGSEYSSSCDSTYPAIATAIDNATSHNIPVVIAAGNDGYSSGISFPACMSEALSVGATTKSDALASYSDIGPNLDVLAPGDSITSTWLGNTFRTESGTSMATPHVSASLAILQEETRLEHGTAYTPAQLLSALESTGASITARGYTKPRIDVYAAALALDNQAPPILSFAPANGSLLLGTHEFNLTTSQNATNVTLTFPETGQRFDFAQGSCLGCWNASVALNKSGAASYNATLHLSDPAGNTRTALYSYSVSYLSIAPASAYALSKDHRTFSFPATSTVSDLLNLTLSVNGTFLANATCTISSSTCLVNETFPTGVSNLTIDATDGNNTANASTLVTADYVAPRFQGIAINRTAATNGSGFMLFANVTDNYLLGNATLSTDFGTLVNLAENETGNATDKTFTFLGRILSNSSGYAVLTVTANDSVGNTNATNESVYLDMDAPAVDYDFPPVANQNGSVHLDFTIVEPDLRSANLTVGPYSYSTFDNGTHVWNLTLASGTYPVLFSMADIFGRSSTNSSTLSVQRPENLTQIVSEMPSTLGNITFSRNGTILNGTQDINATFNLSFSAGVMNITLPNVSGRAMNFYRAGNFTFINATNSSQAIALAGNLSVSVLRFGLFMNFSVFLPAANVSYGVYQLPLSLSGYPLFFLSDDNGSSFVPISACTDRSLQLSQGQACSETNTTLFVYVPHFSGIAAVNDTNPPNITFTGPSTSADSSILLNFSARELSPADPFCNLTTNATNTTVSLPLADFTNSSYVFWYHTTLSDLANGTYQANVSCTDRKNQTAAKTFGFSIADATPPTVSVTTARTTGSVTLAITSDEAVNASFTLGGQRAAFSSRSLTQSRTFSGLASSTAYAYTIRVCDRNDNCITKTGSVTTSALSSGGSGGGGGGGGGGSSGAGTSSHPATMQDAVIIFSGTRTAVSTVFGNLSFSAQLNPATGLQLELKHQSVSGVNASAIGVPAADLLDVYELLPSSDLAANLKAYTLSYTPPPGAGEVALYKSEDGKTWQRVALTYSAGAYHATLSSFSWYAFARVPQKPVAETTTTTVTTTALLSTTTAASTTTTTAFAVAPQGDVSHPAALPWILLAVLVALVGTGAALYLDGRKDRRKKGKV